MNSVVTFKMDRYMVFMMNTAYDQIMLELSMTSIARAAQGMNSDIVEINCDETVQFEYDTE